MSDVKVLRCLCYEDEQPDAKKVKRLLESAWKTITQLDKNGDFEHISIEICLTPTEAWEIISDEVKIKEYQLFIVDMLYNNSVQVGNINLTNEGVNLAGEARKYNKSMGVIGISSADSEIRLDFEESAKLDIPGVKGTFGRVFITKNDLLVKSNIGIDKFADIICDVLSDTGVLGFKRSNDLPILKFNPDITSPPRNEEFSNYYSLKYIVKSVNKNNENNLRELLGAFVDYSSSDWTVHYLAPGWSGAFVLRITGQKDLLFKVSNNEKSLRRELDQYPSVGRSLREIFVAYNNEFSNTSDDQWYAISATFIEDFITMTERVRECTNSQNLESLLDSFFIDGLGLVYRNSVVGDKKCIFDALIPRLDRIARIHLAIQQLEFLARKQTINDRPFDRMIIENYLNEDNQQFISTQKNEVGRSPTYCLSHGDLHGENILVSKERFQFKLIDPAECSPRHWAYDLARFFVDLIVTLWDDIDYSKEEDLIKTNAHEWDGFLKWRELTNNFVNWETDKLKFTKLNQKNTSPPNLGVVTALIWCHQNLRRVHRDRVEHLWEFQLALAVEFMRSAYREHLPTPKRVLGLVAACDALRSCEKTLKAQLGRTNS